MNNLGTEHFEIVAPVQWSVPMVFNSPHSGGFLPKRFLQDSRLSASDLRASEDSHIDELFMGAVEAGALLMRALVSRSFLDLNREPYELDARMFSSPLPTYMNTASPRVASGLGTIPKIVGDGMNIYGGTLELEDALQRIESIYRPYHRTLATLLDEAYGAMQMVLLVDCHSMPSSAVAKTHGRTSSMDIVLGDRYGHACSNLIIEHATQLLADAGLNVIRNKPYAGGFITECHGQPRRNRHAFQIEINRAIYMDEVTRLPNAGYGSLKIILDQLSRGLAEVVNQMARPPVEKWTTKWAAE